MVKIISDSTCDLSEALVKKYNITVVPLHILLGDDEYNDGVTITPEKIYSWSDENRTTPKTSAPDATYVIETFRDALKENDSIISFCISESMSTTGNVMRLAAAELEAEDRISVIDSKNLSTGIGLLVIKAAEMAASGETRENIVEAINQLIPKVRASFVVDTLKYLHRGGRCNAVEAIAGSMLKLHPMIVVNEGKMGVGKKYRGGTERVFSQYYEDIKAGLVNVDKSRVFITHSGFDETLLRKIYNNLCAIGIFDEVCITRAGGVVSSHCGPGTLGILYIDK